MESQQTKSLETLYKRAKTGKIQFWEVRVSSNTSISTITKNSGELGTQNPLTHQENLTTGKNLGRANETTHAQQAVLQAESDWKKKRDEGYKSLTDLGITIGENSTVPVDLLNNLLPASNTDANGNIKPMLATDIDKIKKIEYPVYVQPKLDGFRCLIIVEGDEVTLLSRSGKTFDLPHIADAFKGKGMNVVLDGELYLHGVSFQAISKAIKKPNEMTPKICYYCYDVVDFNLEQMDRLTLRNVSTSMLNHRNIYDVDGTLAHSREEITELHNNYVQMGYEGAMARTRTNKYVSSRSRDLMKVKQFDDEEFEFIHFVLGQRGTEDLVARCFSKNGIMFNAKMQGTREHKEELYNSGIRAGSQLTVKFFGLSEDGIPRFPVGKAFRNNGE